MLLKSDETMFLPVGKSVAPSARCVPLARCGYIIVIAKLCHSTAKRFSAMTECFARKNTLPKKSEFLDSNSLKTAREIIP